MSAAHIGLTLWCEYHVCARTALHRASAAGHEQVVAYLIAQGAAVDVEDSMKSYCVVDRYL